MSHIPFHPAPGFGELLPGNFVVPQNPITGDREVVARVPTIGELLAAHFVVPQNPLLRELTKGNCGCGCNGSGNGNGGCDKANGMSGTGLMGTLTGMGFASTGDTPGGNGGSLNFDPQAIISGNAGLLTYAVLGGGALLLMSLLSSRGSKYREAAESLRKRYPRRGARLASAF